MLQHAVQAFLIAAILAPFSFYAGQAANRLRLPQITGYMVSGIICGPYGLSILSQTSVTDLNIIEGACLGIIGLAAGSELHLSELAKSRRQVISLTVGICVLSWLLCYLTLAWVTGSALLPHFTGKLVTATATLGATIMMARSPASAIAVLKELDARGPFCGLVMAVVVLKDVVVILVFAINLEFVSVALQAAGGTSGFGPMALVLPLMAVCVSVSAGLLVGYVTALGLQYQWYNVLLRALRQPLGGPAVRCRCGWVLLMSTALFQGTRALDAEPLLACVTAGMVLGNRRQPDREHDDLDQLVNAIMSYSNVAFFGLAGASLKLTAIRESVIAALLVVVVRLAAVAAGAQLGAAAGGVRLEHKRIFWLSMITQAGVAMGLARIAGTRFSGWGPHFQTLMMAIIMINLLIGPPMFRSALIQAGEAHGAGLPAQQLHRDGTTPPPHGDDAVVLTTHKDPGGTSEQRSKAALQAQAQA